MSAEDSLANTVSAEQNVAQKPVVPLDGKIAVVTGAGRGIGKHIASALTDAGSAVILVGRTSDNLNLTAETISACGGMTAVEICDLTEPGAAKAVVENTARHFGSPDVLVNNAGVAFREKPSEGLSSEDFNNLVATNFCAMYYTCIGAGNQFKHGGSIINISSVTADKPDPELIAYAATKAAVNSLTRSLATAFGPKEIRVNSIAPDYLDSPLNRDRKVDPARAAAVIGRTPLARWGLRSDVANTACFLASDQSSFITGQTIAVDGGFPYAINFAALQPRGS